MKRNLKAAYRPAILKGEWALHKTTKIRVIVNGALPFDTVVGIFYVTKSSYVYRAVREATKALAALIGAGDSAVGLAGVWFGVPVQIDLIKEKV